MSTPGSSKSSAERPPRKPGPENRPLAWRFAGRVDYRTAIAWQESARQRIHRGDADAETLILLEHDPVITLGKGADPRHVLASPDVLAARGIEVCASSRGGDVTYHGPGQLMVYLVYKLTGSVERYLATIAGALVDTAASLGVPGACWRRDPAGVWLGDAKLAACGLHISRRVAIHGFAFNVATDPAIWPLIVPCGLAAPVTSIADARAQRGLGPPPPVASLAPAAAFRICRALGRRPWPGAAVQS